MQFLCFAEDISQLHIWNRTMDMSGLIQAIQHGTDQERLFMQTQCLQDTRGQLFSKNKHTSMTNTKKPQLSDSIICGRVVKVIYFTQPGCISVLSCEYYTINKSVWGLTARPVNTQGGTYSRTIALSLSCLEQTHSKESEIQSLTINWSLWEYHNIVVLLYCFQPDWKGLDCHPCLLSSTTW